MKFFSILVLTILFNSSQAMADASYEVSFEDTSEFLSPEVDPEGLLNTETWSYVFELIRPNGTTKILNSKNSSVLLKPASTMKIFTGWWSFKMKNRTDAYLYQMLRQSVNTMADDTVQRMGGVLAMEDYFREQGLDLNDSNFIAADGSGLSYDNRANCDVEIKLLKLIRKDTNYTRFKKLLAQPKKDGTLEKRLTSLAGRLFAKTGTLKQTASLTGFLETSQGTVAFCVLSDYLKISVASARQKIDAMVLQNYKLAK